MLLHVVAVMAIRMYELDNEQPDGIDLPDDPNTAYKNQCKLEDFLYRNNYPIRLDWGNGSMKFLVLIESGRDIVGLCALLPYKKQTRKIHLCVMFVVERLRRRGLGTKMLQRIAIMYPQKEITLSVMFEQADVLKFYMNRGYARLDSIDTSKKCFVLSLVNLMLLKDLSLPD